MRYTSKDVADDVLIVSQIDAIPTLLQVICETTGMRFAAVARVTDRVWTACAVRDDIQFGLLPGGQLDVNTTICREVMSTGTPVVIDHASVDPRFNTHRTPKMYGFESYVSVPIITRDGGYFGNLCALDPLPVSVSDPRIVSMFVRFAQLIADQVDIKRLHAKANAALDEERAAGELRELFIAILGHDLRAPLKTIQATAAELAKRIWDPGLLKIASTLNANAGRMSSLIDDVLDFARHRFGPGITLQCREVTDLDALLAAVVEELAARHPERKIISNISVQRIIDCDPARLQQLAANLLDNALTYGAPGGPVSFIASVVDDEVSIEVWNDGPPIPAEAIPTIFAPFWRRSTADNREGVGLGLHVCWQIVRAHQGQITVTSTKKNGTQFIVRMPLGPILSV